jgi:acetyl-CoA carboxylase biotin carboxyl carrier protein
VAEESKQEPAEAHDVFDVRRVRRLVALMNEHDLSEIDLRQGNQRVRLRRGAEQPVFTAQPNYGPAPYAPAGPAPAPSASASGPAPAAAPAGKTINSPMVGTFYLSSSPDAAAFVKIGDQVGPDTTICIIEAMKVFNEIPAETSGKITAVLVENGAPVEFGQPLFRIE